MKRVLRMILPDSVLNTTRPWRYRARLARIRLRASSGGERIAPSFLIVGAMKGGTTSLFQYLLAHPGVAAPIVKEIHYFNFNWSRSPNWYLAHFPKRAAVAEGSITGEASPGYMVHPRAPARILERLPDARILIIYRDPVARALSHYFHARRVGHEHRDIEDALFSPSSYAQFNLAPDQELAWYDAMNSGLGRRHRNRALIESSPMHLAYISQSRYADFLPAWQQCFAPDRLLIMKSEDLFSEPIAELARAQKFLGLTADAGRHLPAHNTGKYPASVPREIIQRLQAEFAEPNRRLEQLVGDGFGWPGYDTEAGGNG